MTRSLAPKFSLSAMLTGIVGAGLVLSATANPESLSASFGFLASLALVALAGIVAAWRKQRRLTLLLAGAIALALTVKVYSSFVSIGDGWPTRAVRLSVVGAGDADYQAIGVFWLEPGPNGTVEVPWQAQHADERGCEFTSPTTLHVAEHSWAFGSSIGWGYSLDRPVLIRLGDGRELAFPLSELIDVSHSGIPPAELRANLNVQERLRDTARPTDVAWILRSMELPPRVSDELAK